VSFEGSNGHAELDVYYRSTSNHLAEIDIDIFRVTRVFDISNRTGFGSITGTPAIAIAYKEQGEASALSVVVKQLTTNKIFTWDWRRQATGSYPQDWSRHAVLMADGFQAISFGSVFSTEHSGFPAYIAAKTASDRFTVFETQSGSAPFIFLNQYGPTGRPGVLTFGTPDTNSHLTCTMLFNETTNRIDWWRVRDLTTRGTYSTSINAGGSVFSTLALAPDLDSPGSMTFAPGWGRSWPDGNLLRYAMNGNFVKVVKTFVPVISGISPLICDDNFCQNRPFATFASTANPSSSGQPSLWGSEGTSATTIDMFYPGGILAP